MDVTALMMTYNSQKTMWDALRSLARQGSATSLVLCDNGSTDGMDIYSAAFRANMELLQFNSLRLIEVPQTSGFEGHARALKNWEHMLARFAFEIRNDPPDAVMILDSDVIMPEGGLDRLTERMLVGKTLGAVGIRYMEAKDHLPFGCSLYRYAAFKELAEAGFSSIGCVCRWMHRTLEANGWEVDTLDGIIAEHRKEK